MGSPEQTGREAARRRAIGKASSARMKARQCPRCARKGALTKAARVSGFLPVQVCRYCGFEQGGNAL